MHVLTCASPVFLFLHVGFPELVAFAPCPPPCLVAFAPCLVAFAPCLPPAMSDSKLTFFLNGKRTVLEGHEFHPRMTLLDYLREGAIGLTGTKASCTQGGCKWLITLAAGSVGRAWACRASFFCLRPFYTTTSRGLMTSTSVTTATCLHGIVCTDHTYAVLFDCRWGLHGDAVEPQQVRITRPTKLGPFSHPRSFFVVVVVALQRDRPGRAQSLQRVSPPAALYGGPARHDHRGHPRLR